MAILDRVPLFGSFSPTECMVLSFCCIGFLFFVFCFFLAQVVKNLPEMQETLVRSLGWKDPLEEEMATHSSILAWRIPWTEELGGLQSMGSQRVRHD